MPLWKCDNGTYDVTDDEGVIQLWNIPVSVFEDAAFDYVANLHSQKPSRADLTKAQEREWPGSRILTPKQAFKEWCLLELNGQPGAYVHLMDNCHTFALVMAQHDPVIFYVTAYGHRGARYGVNGPDYVSGFDGSAL